MLKVLLINPNEILYEGKAGSVVLPGEMGVFEILPGHKRIISRLFTGKIDIDDREYFIRRGLVTAEKNDVTIIAEDLNEEL